ncbi:signal peptidase II [Atopobacter sp. AH10]|uniref:signal peptidase II n=1 Tax=Atopobacter sp. AH10 TaxID=2315861 RepID=UPI000EF22EFF|nr:signal peptidase II [Atopobacter sp. AH10]RLK63740.1 signal peptidase II [Atopobacter sp. AH10]
MYIILVITALLLDQAMKFWTVSHLKLGESQHFLPGIVSLHHIRNFGAAWGVFSHSRIFLLLITLLASCFIIHLMRQEIHRSKALATGYALVLSGALGNGLDRFRLGYVVDMFDFDFINFPIFNLADCFISLGVVILLLAYLYLDKQKEKGAML